MPAQPPVLPIELALLAPQPDADYLWIPQKLLDTLRDSPLAIGLYATIARRWLADGSDPAGLALSDRDLLAFDPSLSRSAIMRALRRLIDGSWLWADRQRGHKTRYVPTWGRSKTGQLKLWKRTKGCGLGRGQTPTIRISRALLDDYMGRIIPHPRRAAVIERFSTEAQLTLRDVGTHALLQRQRVAAGTPQLEAAGLSREGMALAVPQTREILATAELSVQGMQRLGMAAPGAIQAPRPVADPRPPVFFTAPQWFGEWSGQWRGVQATDQRRFAASERHEIAAESNDAKPTGMKGMKGMLGKNLNPLHPPANACGGLAVMSNEWGSASNESEDQPTKRPNRPGGVVRKIAKPIPDTPTAHLLRGINVRPDQISELADLPLALAEAALADAKGRAGIKSIPSWVVSLLRDARDQGFVIGGDPSTPAADETTTLDVAKYTTGEYAGFFQVDRGDTPAAPVPPEIPAVPVAPVAPMIPPAPDDLAGIWQVVQATLAAQMTPADYRADIAPLQLAALRPGQAELLAPTPAVRDRVLERWRGVLQRALADVRGDPCPKLVIRLGPAPLPARSAPARPPAPIQPEPTPALSPTPAADAAALPPPPWVTRPDVWPRLSRVIQAALASSSVDADGQIVGANPFLTKQIQTRYGREVAALRGEEDTTDG